MRINVYTDGACSNNGRPNAKAGLGVYFGENDARNKYARITGKQTNNRAEVMALLTAAKILYREINAGYDIHIYSDSTYAMRCCGEYGEKLHAKNWTSNKPIPNLELVQIAYETFKRHDNITFHYIAAHTGLDDEHSRGNEGADRLANLAIGQTSCQYANKPTKIYLNIPYCEKDEGKKLGTKWDPKKKKWYIFSNSNNKEIILSRWANI
jgi:ribonuclease HI